MDCPPTGETWDLIRKGLHHRTTIVVSQAAQVTAHFNWLDGVPLLVKTYERLLKNPTQSDPGCLGKRGIVEALRKMEVSEKDVFLHGIRYQQFEPMWGGVEDRAAGLRAECALALAKLHPSDALIPIADVLADPEIEARRGAAIALSSGFSLCALPLLRVRALSGETDASVLEIIFQALLDLAPGYQSDESVAFVGRFLEGETEEISAVAALALGTSRCPEAFDRLRNFVEMSREESRRKVALDALAISRTDQAIAYLLDLIGRGNLIEANMVKDSLRIFRADPIFWAKVEERYAARENPNLD